MLIQHRPYRKHLFMMDSCYTGCLWLCGWTDSHTLAMGRATRPKVKFLLNL